LKLLKSFKKTASPIPESEEMIGDYMKELHFEKRKGLIYICNRIPE
jgi:hypothetical protein